ncbi:hypothetical protein BU16DRAFT_131633 [Lophium mytilinum]|uniref:Uncharacterized protein n=1 Tax=Lophium mytilinum TaxID=390894 RepID=A0A6A6QFA2_9PEZI|nr:hypothetical protein BU16DRAFT_131633 [Lophium mytilinum]
MPLNYLDGSAGDRKTRRQEVRDFQPARTVIPSQAERAAPSRSLDTTREASRSHHENSQSRNTTREASRPHHESSQSQSRSRAHGSNSQSHARVREVLPSTSHPSGHGLAREVRPSASYQGSQPRRSERDRLPSSSMRRTVARAPTSNGDLKLRFQSKEEAVEYGRKLMEEGGKFADGFEIIHTTYATEDGKEVPGSKKRTKAEYDGSGAQLSYGVYGGSSATDRERTAQSKPSSSKYGGSSATDRERRTTQSKPSSSKYGGSSRYGSNY